ncbi:MAG TPA: hypothetical protein VIW94_08805 [Acidimicrobiia bacterium]
MGYEVVGEEADSDRVDSTYPHVLRQPSQLRELGVPYRIEGINRSTCGPHLHNQALLPIDGHQVDFASADSEVSANNREAMSVEELGGQGFPKAAERGPSG